MQPAEEKEEEEKRNYWLERDELLCNLFVVSTETQRKLKKKTSKNPSSCSWSSKFWSSTFPFTICRIKIYKLLINIQYYHLLFICIPSKSHKTGPASLIALHAGLCPSPQCDHTRRRHSPTICRKVHENGLPRALASHNVEAIRSAEAIAPNNWPVSDLVRPQI